MNLLGFKLLTLKEISFYSVPAILGSFVTYAYGGWSQSLELLVWLMGADYITGVLCALKEKKGIHSSSSFWGLIKKGLMLFSILIGYKLDLIFGSSGIMIACVYFWIANELISLTENYGRLGLPMPDAIKSKIAILKGRVHKI